MKFFTMQRGRRNNYSSLNRMSNYVHHMATKQLAINLRIIVDKLNDGLDTTDNQSNTNTRFNCFKETSFLDFCSNSVGLYMEANK